MYYNTNNESGSELAASNRQTVRQEDVIVEYFRSGASLAKFQVDDRLQADGFRWPTQSVTRAIANLTKEGRLEKTDEMVMGPYGKRVHKWRLPKPKEPQQIGMFDA